MKSQEIRLLQEALASEKQTKEIYRTAAASTDSPNVKNLFLQLARMNSIQQERLVELLFRNNGSHGIVDTKHPESETVLTVLSESESEKSSFPDNEYPRPIESKPSENGHIIPGVPDRILMERLFDGVFFVDAKRKIRFWNLGAERITGLSSGEMVGRDCKSLNLTRTQQNGFPGKDTYCPVEEVMETGLPREMRLYFPSRTGIGIPTDFLSTPVIKDGQLLGVVEVFRDATTYDQIEKVNRQLNEMAYKDSLTGVPSRRWVIEQLQFGAKQVQRQKSGLWVGLVDVDDFKTINDRYGHFAGDRVLVEIAQNANSRFRESDLFGRIGGDEFLFAFMHAQPENVEILTRRAKEGFSGFGPPELPERVTVSIGMAAFRSDEDKNIEDVVNRADQALYEAKRKGRDQIVLVS